MKIKTYFVYWEGSSSTDTLSGNCFYNMNILEKNIKNVAKEILESIQKDYPEIKSIIIKSFTPIL